MSIGFKQSKAQALVASPRFLHWLAVLTWGFLLVSVIALIFVPWQQTVIGIGKVTVFSPMQRPQSIQAQISGRLKVWHVMEGQTVQAGEVIAELADLDPKFLDIHQIETLEEQKQALMERKVAAQVRIAALKNQLNALEQSRKAAIPGAGEKVAQNRERILASQQALEAARQNRDTADYNYNRVRDLHQKGLRSKRDFELAELDKVRAETGVQEAEALLRVAQRDVSVAQFDQGKVTGDTAAALANVSAAMASAQETIASATSDIAKLNVDIQNLKQRMEQRQVTTPISGKIVRVLQVGAGETVRAGDILTVVVPETHDQAVELYVSDWDVPLVSEGSLVRLQFAGWPAIQFSGWPMIAGGTFGGRVAVVDAVDDGKGQYRILVKPDMEAIESGRDEPWPSGNYLRPGTEATGWILLDTVPLGYELWRQFNAFPPTLKDKPGEEGTQGGEGGREKPVKRKAKK